MRPPRSKYVWPLMFAALWGSACGDDAGGTLMVTVTTDLSVPVDIDWLTWEITRSGESKPMRVSGSAIEAEELPATLAINTKEGVGGSVRVRLQGRRGGADGELVVEREAEATLPSDGVKELWMPLNWLCSRSNQAEACAEGETCREGDCQALDTEHSEEFPDYAEPDGGACFDAQECFKTWGFIGQPQVWRPETGTCELTGGETRGGEHVNVALAVNAGLVGSQGACTDQECFIVLDKDTREGWTTLRDDKGQARGIGLPNAVCQALQDRTLGGIVVLDATPECPVKTRDRRLCSAEPRCVPADGPCSAEWPPEVWQGFACSGGQDPKDLDARLACWPPVDPPDGDTTGRQCCTIGETPPQSDPTLIDDMSGGPQIKFHPEPGLSGGYWFTSSSDAAAITPRPNHLVPYRAVDPPILLDGYDVHHAVCLESTGIDGDYAQVGFTFHKEFRPFDVSDFRGMSFWAWAKDPYTTINVQLSNVDTNRNYLGAACREDGLEACFDDFRIQLELPTEWSLIEFEWSDLEQRGFGSQFDEFDPNVLHVAFSFLAPGTHKSQPFEYCISLVRFLEH